LFRLDVYWEGVIKTYIPINMKEKEGQVEVMLQGQVGKPEERKQGWVEKNWVFIEVNSW
jgi:hypothetical protein